jgi:hypothetical protein
MGRIVKEGFIKLVNLIFGRWKKYHN